MMVRLLKSWTMNTGKKLAKGQVTNRMRKEAEQLIKSGIAEEYKGGFPPKQMKTDFFKPK